jgi:hypothetical protein
MHVATIPYCAAVGNGVHGIGGHFIAVGCDGATQSDFAGWEHGAGITNTSTGTPCFGPAAAAGCPAACFFR